MLGGTLSLTQSINQFPAATTIYITHWIQLDTEKGPRSLGSSASAQGSLSLEYKHEYVVQWNSSTSARLHLWNCRLNLFYFRLSAYQFDFYGPFLAVTRHSTYLVAKVFRRNGVQSRSLSPRSPWQLEGKCTLKGGRRISRQQWVWPPLYVHGLR